MRITTSGPTITGVSEDMKLTLSRGETVTLAQAAREVIDLWAEMHMTTPRDREGREILFRDRNRFAIGAADQYPVVAEIAPGVRLAVAFDGRRGESYLVAKMEGRPVADTRWPGWADWLAEYVAPETVAGIVVQHMAQAILDYAISDADAEALTIDEALMRYGESHTHK